MTAARLYFTWLCACCIVSGTYAYPIDGYETTGIRRLELLRLRVARKLSGPIPVSGGLKTMADIRLHLLQPPGNSLDTFPVAEPSLQQRLTPLFPNLWSVS